jgi:thymidylate kinase
VIVVFSGTDGAGKSTQIFRLTEFLESTGFRTKYVWARGGYTPVMLILKTLFLRIFGRRGNSAGYDRARSAQYVERRSMLMKRRLVSRIWLAGATLDLILLYGIYIRILSAAGHIVICDRFIGDTKIDFERNFGDRFNPRGLLWRVLEQVVPRPQAYFLLTVPAAISRCRSIAKNEPFPDDQDTLVFRLDCYQNRPEFNSENVVTLDGTDPIETISEKIQKLVMFKLDRVSEE